MRLNGTGVLEKKMDRGRKSKKRRPFMSSFIFAFSVFSYMLEHVQRAYVPMSLHVFMC